MTPEELAEIEWALCVNCGRCAGCHQPSCEIAAMTYCITGSCPLEFWDRPPLIAELKRCQAVIAADGQEVIATWYIPALAGTTTENGE